MFDLDSYNIEYFRTSRQKVNESPCGVRVKHKETGIIIDCELYDKLYQNRITAIKMMILELERISK
jgi:protein subunit release factor A